MLKKKRKKKKSPVLQTSQLSRIKDLSIGHPPPSLKTLHMEFVNDSQSLRSTSCKHWHCNASVVKLSCFCKDSFCKSTNSLLQNSLSDKDKVTKKIKNKKKGFSNSLTQIQTWSEFEVILIRWSRGQLETVIEDSIVLRKFRSANLQWKKKIEFKRMKKNKNQSWFKKEKIWSEAAKIRGVVKVLAAMY